MVITEVRVFPVGEDKLKAFASIIIDSCFVVGDIKIIQGVNGLFVSMPSKKRTNGTFRDIAQPINSKTRRQIEDLVIEKYREVAASLGSPDASPVRPIEQSEFDLDDPRSGA